MLPTTKKLTASIISKQSLLDVFSVVGASLFIALCAQISIPLYGNLVPITLQTLAVMLVGGTLGSKKGAWAIITYCTEALCGWPVLAEGGAGLAILVGSTAGYIMGFLLQAYLTGLYFENTKNRNSGITFLALSFICMLQLLMGSMWLAAYIGWQNAFVFGFYPFIAGELLKSMAVTYYFKNKSAS